MFSVFQLNCLSLSMELQIVTSKTNHYCNDLFSYDLVLTLINVLQNPGNSNSEGERKIVRASEGSSYRGRFEKLSCHVTITFLIKGKEIQFELLRVRSRVNLVKMIGKLKWSEIRGKLDLVQRYCCFTCMNHV